MIDLACEIGHPKKQEMTMNKDLIEKIVSATIKEDSEYFSTPHWSYGRLYVTDGHIAFDLDHEEDPPPEYEGLQQIVCQLRGHFVNAFSRPLRINKELPPIEGDSGLRFDSYLSLGPYTSQFEGAKFQNYYLALLHSLPRCRAAYSPEDDAMLFAFEGGYGILKRVASRSALDGPF